jgi:hypothetical protein
MLCCSTNWSRSYPHGDASLAFDFPIGPYRALENNGGLFLRNAERHPGKEKARAKKREASTVSTANGGGAVNSRSPGDTALGSGSRRLGHPNLNGFLPGLTELRR